ncbi:hypothetical protein ASG54_13765 [Aureimonas sp. Leaf460]|nr:hypothetical protein ASG62_02450 [Aureimonas sp. Leaf427]KQT76267.1 hypothetical protein ASG54_13765 [Aureimonas sp. Leaf460]
MQRAVGAARAEVAVVAGRTRLRRLHQAGALKLRFPTVHEGLGAEAILINSCGGLAGGDRLSQGFTLAEASSLTVTTQACERVYRTLGDAASVETQAHVGADARFLFVPQETILFDGGALRRRLEVDMAASSTVILCESVILGRETMGESVVTGEIRDRWRIRREGRLVFADDLRLSGPVSQVAARAASLCGARAFSTILFQGAAPEARLAALRAIVGDAGGASLVDGLILVRLVASGGLALRRRLVPVLAALADGPLPRIWST